MILFYTPNSPYARTARIALREWNVLEFAEERRAANREADNPVLEFSPAGRVPTLVHAGFVITEARNVFAYIKDFANAGNTDVVSPSDWESVAQEGQIASFLEGIAFWVRENRRAIGSRSEFLLTVERDRMTRCLKYLDAMAANGVLPPVSEFRGAALASALHLMDAHHFCPDWDRNKALAGWFEDQANKPSMRATEPQT